jgi:hypothetical protein
MVDGAEAAHEVGSDVVGLKSPRWQPSDSAPTPCPSPPFATFRRCAEIEIDNLRAAFVWSQEHAEFISHMCRCCIGCAQVLTGDLVAAADRFSEVAAEAQVAHDPPVKLVGLGEGPHDLAPFEPAAFVDALLG